MVFYAAMGFISLFLTAVTWVVIVDAIASWFVRPNELPRSVTGPMTEPLYRPIRSVLDPGKMGGLDLSPLVVVVAVEAVRSLLLRYM